MIKIIHYDPKFDEDIENLDTGMFMMLRTHGDVLKDTAVIALSDGQFMGCGFLTAGASFRQIDRPLPCYHIHLEFKAVQNGDDEEEVEASAMLLGTLMNLFEKLQKKYPDKRLILRTWVSASDTAMLDFMESAGFSASRVMLQMEQYLVFDPDDRFPEPEDYFEEDGIALEMLDPEDEAQCAAYFEQNGKCFMVPDSPEELSYRMGVCGGQVWLLTRNKKLLSSVSLWNTWAPDETEFEDGCIATENIFTAEDEQRKGYAEYLLSKVIDRLAGKNASMVTLNVYADDLPAIVLYQKLGYETVDEKLELHYETAPVYIPY